MFQKIPFRKATFQDRFYQLRCQDDFKGFFRAHNALGYSMDALRVIWCCINPNAHLRPSIFDLLQCPFASLPQGENMEATSDII